MTKPEDLMVLLLSGRAHVGRLCDAENASCKSSGIVGINNVRLSEPHCSLLLVALLIFCSCFAGLLPLFLLLGCCWCAAGLLLGCCWFAALVCCFCSLMVSAGLLLAGCCWCAAGLLVYHSAACLEACLRVALGYVLVDFGRSMFIHVHTQPLRICTLSTAPCLLHPLTL